MSEIEKIEIEHKAGIFADESEELIRYTKGWSKSSLDHVSRSMMHYFHNKNNPKEQTDAMLLGSAFHCLSLTPEKFENKFAIAPKVDKRTSAGKDLWNSFLSANKGKSILTKEDGDRADAMAKALLSHPDAAEMLMNGTPEVAMFWTHKQTGLKCKGKTDFLRNDRIMIELKKTSDASYHEFQRKINDYRYHVQAAFYLDVIKAATGQDMKGFLFAAVEKDAPFNIGVYAMEQEDLEVGKREYMKDLLVYRECLKTGIWPSYNYENGQPMIKKLKLPKWAYYD